MASHFVRTTAVLDASRAAQGNASEAIKADVAHLMWPDALRIIAAFWVVVIHVSAVPMTHFETIPPEWWWWSDVYNAASRAAVPLFVMASGALLLTQRRWNTAHFFYRRTAKIVIPLMAWTALYAAWRLFFLHEHLSPDQLVHHAIDGLHNPIYPHLWFLYVILSMYLITPIVRPFVLHAPRAAHAYFAALWLVATIVQPRLSQAGLGVGLSLEPALGFVGYFVIGASIAKFIRPRLSPGVLASCLLAFFVGVATAAILTHHLTQTDNGVLNENFLAPFAPGIALMTMSAFLMLRHFFSSGKSRNGLAKRRLAYFAALSYGIYLVHPMFIDVLAVLGFHLDPISNPTVWFVPLVAVLTFCLSAAATGILRSSSAFRWLVP